MNAPQEISARFPRALRNPIFWSIGLGLVVVGIMAYSLFTGSRMAKCYVPLMDAAMEIKLEAAAARLWFEEVISGDLREDISAVWERLDRSMWYARAMLEGGEDPEGVIIPLRNPTLHREIAEVQMRIMDFRAITEERWATVERSASGTDIDRRFDAVFEDLLDQADEVKAMLRGAMTNDLRRFRIVQGFLIAVCLGLSVLIGITFQRYRRRRALDLSALRESEERYRTLLEASPAGVIAIQDDRIAYVNDAAVSIAGASDRGAFMGRHVSDVLQTFTPQSSQILMDRLRRAEQGESNPRIELEIVRSDGSRGIVASRSLGVTLGGRPAVLQLFQDITESKRHEGTLKESEQKYRTLVDQSPDGIFIADMQGKFISVNAAMTKELGYSEEEFLSATIWDILPPEYVEQHKSRLAKIKAGENTDEPVEYEVKRKDGDARFIEVLSAPYIRGGKIVGFQGIARDITERKLAEAKLRESEERFSVAFHRSPYPIAISEIPSGKLLEINRAFERVSGYKAEEAVGRTFVELGLMPADEREFLFQTLQEKGGVRGVEVDFRNRAGSPIHSLYNASIVNIRSKPHQLTIIEDITKRRKAEEEVRISAERFRNYMEQASEGIYLFEMPEPISTDLPVEKQVALIYEGHIAECNDALARMYGYDSHEKLVGKSLQELHGGTDKQENVEFLSKWIESGYRILGAESHEIDRDGNEKWFSNNSIGIIEGGRLHRIWGTQTDITERKRAEEALRASESKFRAVFDQSLQLAGLLSIDGTLVEVNRKALDLIGAKAEEVIGKPFWETLWWSHSPKESELIRAVVKKAAAGQVVDFETTPVDAQGRTHDIFGVMGPVKDDSGNMIGILPVGIDITDRKIAERELFASRERLRALAAELSATEERERHRIATYLHDQIGQSLAVLQMKFGALSEEAGAEHLMGSIAEIAALLDRIMDDTRTLTFDLSPPILYELGLSAALEWFGERTAEEHGLQFSYSDDGRPKPLDSEIAGLIFRNARELIVNVVKHADADRIRASLSVDDGNLHVTIEDDGGGFDVSKIQQARRITGFGLFSIRERMHFIGGRLEIESSPGRGTRATLCLPLQSEEDPGKGA